jgi:hypothetical protein
MLAITRNDRKKRVRKLVLACADCVIGNEKYPRKV